VNPFSTTLLATSLLAVPAAARAGGLPAFTDSFPTPDGHAVEIAVVKHATLRIRYAGMEIHVDPVADAIPPATDYAAFPKADLILVTHEHFDHFDRAAIETLRHPGTVLVANPRVRDALGFGTALANGGTAAIRDGVSVEAVPAHNTTPDRLQFHPRGRDNGYVLTLGGFRLYIAGDTEQTPEMPTLRNIDLAFLPCNLPYTMTPAQTAAAALAFRPKTLIPYHCEPASARAVADLLADSPVTVLLRP